MDASQTTERLSDESRRYRAGSESVEVAHVDHPGEDTYGPEDAEVTDVSAVSDETANVQAADPMGMSSSGDDDAA